tara:strand:- start:630 stop:1190 length:561 start_codon:yes stop_codon:yes gene_type:complete
MLQTAVHNSNRQEFYKNVYYMQTNSRDQLINLAEFDNTCILIDCCGAYYKTLFQQNIFVLETVNSFKEYKFSRDQFDKLIDNQIDGHIKWPTINILTPVLIFDRSPLIKYLDINNLCHLVSNAAEQYQASNIVLRQKLCFVDDARITDRFYNFYNFKIKNYCIEKFLYNVNTNECHIQLKRILSVE